MTKVKTVISQEESEAISKIPAPFSNKIYVSSSPAGVRLTFSEISAAVSLPAARSAVYLSISDAVALRDLLTENLKNYKMVAASEPEGTVKDG